jgi:single-strand DNA-binding protein
MSDGANLCTFVGTLGRDPELRYTRTKSEAILNFSIACSESYRQGNEWKERTEWVPVTVWGKRAESLAKLLVKGSRVVVIGKYHTSKSDGREGEVRYFTSIQATNVILAGGKRAESTESQPEQGDDPLPF